jgi:hypothetical protein
MLADFRASTISIECAPCGRRGRYNIGQLMEKYGDIKLPDLRHWSCPYLTGQSAIEFAPG